MKDFTIRFVAAIIVIAIALGVATVVAMLINNISTYQDAPRNSAIAFVLFFLPFLVVGLKLSPQIVARITKENKK